MIVCLLALLILEIFSICTFRFQNITTNEVIKTLKSNDGNTSINVYTTLEKESGINPKIEKIVISNKNGNFVINDIIGYYDNMRWVMGQSKAVIEYYGRTWRNFLIVDTEKNEVLYKESFTFQEFMDEFKKQGTAFNYKVNENRPDAEFTFNKMIDDDNIIIDYKVYDENYLIQSGSFKYNLSKGTFSELIQNKPKSGG